MFHHLAPAVCIATAEPQHKKSKLFVFKYVIVQLSFHCAIYIFEEPVVGLA